MQEYLQSTEEILKSQSTTASGLSKGEIVKRQAEHGSNQLKAAPKKSLGKRIVEQISDPMIIILAAAAILSAFMATKNKFTAI